MYGLEPHSNLWFQLTYAPLQNKSLLQIINLIFKVNKNSVVQLENIHDLALKDSMMNHKKSTDFVEWSSGYLNWQNRNLKYIMLYFEWWH